MLKFLLALGTGLLVGYIYGVHSGRATPVVKTKRAAEASSSGSQSGQSFASESAELGEDTRDELGLPTPIQGIKV